MHDTFYLQKILMLLIGPLYRHLLKKPFLALALWVIKCARVWWGWGGIIISGKGSGLRKCTR